MKTIVALLLLGNLGVFVWQTYDKRVAPAPAPEPVSEEDNRVNRLPLLSELDPGALRERSLEHDPDASAEAFAADATDGDDPQVSVRCFIVGPFKPGDPRPSSARSWLERRKASVTLLENERREQTLHWVHFPPAAGRSEALARVEELKARGIDDLQVVQRGDMANAISVGVFSKPISRDRRLVEMRQKGYQPEVAKRYRAVKADWLAVRIADETFDTEDFSDEFPGLELNQASCRQG